MTPSSLTLTFWQRHTDQTGAGRLPFGLFRYAYMFHRIITIIIMSMSWWQKVCVFVYHIGVSYTLRRNAHAGRHHFLLSLSAVCTNHLLSLRVDSARARAGPARRITNDDERRNVRATAHTHLYAMYLSTQSSGAHGPVQHIDHGACEYSRRMNTETRRDGARTRSVLLGTS